MYVNGEKLRLRDILFGVPQGSILGPLLFTCYVNALLSLLYADDTTYFIAEKCIHELYRKMNLYMSRAELWFLCNKLTLHPGKTRYILFIQVNPPGNLLLMGQKNKQVPDAGEETSFKLVGVMIDEHLIWKYHINKVKSKIAQAIALICRLFVTEKSCCLNHS
jgi:hypothetical protein